MARLLVVVDYQLTGFIEAVNTFCEPLLDNEIRNDLFYLNVVFMAEE